jgi:phosphonate transport system permease protein
VNSIARADQAENQANLRRALIGAALVVLIVFSWRTAEVRPAALFASESVSAVADFLRGLFPPDVSADFLAVVFAAAGRTISIAIAGTLLSILIGLPLGVLAAATLFRRGVLLAGERRGVSTFLLAGVSRAARGLLGFLRAVPDLMWGLLFVVAVGLGPLAGALALAVSYAGVLGRVYADVFDSVDARPVEALHATGATRSQVFARAVWPQSRPTIIAYTLYSFECCMRAASVLGFIGAGGIGYEISLSMRLYRYDQVLTLIIAFILLLTATDAFSRYLRRRFRANAPQGTLAHERFNGLGLITGIPLERVMSVSIAVAAIAAVTASFYASGFFDGSLTDATLLGRISRFVGAMMPPELSGAFLSSLVEPLFQTIAISVMGTLIGMITGAMLALPATATLIFVEADEAGKRSRLERAARRVTYTLARTVLSLLRSIPELVWVLMCIIAVGLGPFAGALAIGLHTGGVLGKLYAETLEEVPENPLEALRSTGARRMQILAWGIWPQARPMLVSYTVLRWETNLRVSTVLGLVGGGGLGQAIYNNIQLGFYTKVATLILAVYALVVTTDWIGDRLRERPA